MPRAQTVLLVGALTLLVAALLLFFLHDRFWWPPDEGVYAFVAQQILEGQRLHAEVQDLHPGYVQLVGAGALWLFGEDIVSLRYPLVALTLMVAGLVFRALLERGLAVAAMAALMTAGLTLPLFLNPTANWYGQLIGLGLAAGLTRRERLPNAFFLGAVVGLAFLFRQLNGVFVGAAALLWLVYALERAEASGSFTGRRGRLASLLLVAVAAVLGLYLSGKAVGLAWPLFGLWPVALLLLGAWHLRPSDRALLSALSRFVLGAGAAALPLLLWHLSEGSLGAWLDDTFLTPWRIAGQAFLADPGYTRLLILAVVTLGESPDLLAGATALLWVLMLLLPVIVGGAAVFAWLRSLSGGPAVSPLLLFAPFLALAAVHYQIPVYLFFAIAPLWIGLLAAGRSHGARRFTVVLAAPCLALTLWTQAAQPLERSLTGVVAGARLPLDATDGLPKASVAMQTGTQALYRELLAAIEVHVSSSETLLALPMNPELYFLSGRRPPVHFFAAQLGLAGPEDLAKALTAIEAAPPALVIHRQGDKYDGPLVQALLAELLPAYEELEPVGPFRLYRRSEAP